MVNLEAPSILPALGLIAATLADFGAVSMNPGFDIRSVAELAQSLPTHSWEFGTSAQALLELYNPELSVFGETPFPVPTVAPEDVRALSYAASTIKLGKGYSALAAGNGAAGDPAALGVSAVMLGKSNSTFAKAAKDTWDGLWNDVPRFKNGAISHRANIPELWADFMYMAPPFLAYYAADKEDAEGLQNAVQQCRLYRQVLQPNVTGQYKGIWMHIIGPQSQDTELWATGNAWAAAGMSRVLATVMKASFINNLAWKQQAITDITSYIKEIVDGVMKAPMDDKLLRNYVSDTSNSGHGFGEISGSSLLAATVYRMAVLQPGSFGASYISWAEGIRGTLSGNDADGNPHITPKGIATPAVNPLAWKDIKPFTKGSPEGQAFVVLMYSAWRDCVKASICDALPATEVGEIQTTSKRSTHHGRRHFMNKHISH